MEKYSQTMAFFSVIGRYFLWSFNRILRLFSSQFNERSRNEKYPKKNPPSLPYDPLNLPIHNNSTNITIKASSGLTIRRLTARKNIKIQNKDWPLIKMIRTEK
jgi:hypothetical protein